MSAPSPQTLVRSVIEHFQFHPDKLGGEPKPIAPELLENLTLAGEKPLPPSLKLWLSFDARNLGLSQSTAQLTPTPLSISDWGGFAFQTLQRLLLPDALYPLYPGGDDSMWFLYAGEADGDGEYPIFVADIDDQYYVRLYAPNFAVWLADRPQIWDFNLYRREDNPQGYASLFEHPDFGPLMRQQSHLNFHGYRYCEIYGDAITVEGEKSQWCSDDDLIFDLRNQGFDDKTINAILRS